MKTGVTPEMCGICGKLGLHGEKIDRDLLKRMCDSLAYRGPDDEGLYLSGNVGLAHRRLSIIDLSSAGHQPMCNEDGTIWLVFNGEIYDFGSLQRRLFTRGHTLKSRTDCETIIHLYEEEGTDCLRHLKGMFAFALWDENRQRLWLVRDRVGIKPLYYYWDGRQLLFASEIKALLLDPDVAREIDPEALDLYLTLSYIPAPWTIFRNMRKVLPGTSVVYERGILSEKTYWDLEEERTRAYHPDRPAQDLDPIKGQLRGLLEESVKRRMISDVPLGAFLSGGLDSSIVVALMARNSSRPVKTFSIGYKDLPAFDETRYAREVAGFNGTDHHEFKLGHRDILEAFPLVLENVDEPFSDSSAVPTHIVSRETRGHVTVALSGDGGDELFAGYRMYMGEYWARHYSRLPRIAREGLIAPLIQAMPDSRDNPRLEMVRRLKKFVTGMSRSFSERFCGWREIFPFSLRQKLPCRPMSENFYLDRVRETVLSKRDRFGNDSVNLMLYMDMKGLLPGDMLTKVDRMSMANSLEVRVPFLDHTFVEFAFKLPGSTKLRARGGKYILLEAFRDHLPPMIHNRPKWGFEMPIGAWLRNELRFLVDEYLEEGTIERQGLFNHGVIRGLITDHMARRRDTSWQLWNLIVFQHWYGRYMA